MSRQRPLWPACASSAPTRTGSPDSSPISSAMVWPGRSTVGWHCRPDDSGDRSEVLDHAGVAQRVRFDPRQVEELRHTLVRGEQQFDVDLGLDGEVRDRLEDERHEEPGLEGKTEYPVATDRTGLG